MPPGVDWVFFFFRFYLTPDVREVNFKNDFTLLEIKLGDKKRTSCQHDSESGNILFSGDGPGGRMAARHNCL